MTMGPSMPPGRASAMRMFGAFLCVGSVLGSLVLLFGMLRRKYWAVAAPVGIGSLAALYIAFWIGRTLIGYSREELPEE